MDVMDNYVRKGYYLPPGDEKCYATDLIYFLWTNEASPLFGKERMTTFERYFIKDKRAHEEPKTPYYRLYNDETIVNQILEEFDLADGCGSYCQRSCSGQAERRVNPRSSAAVSSSSLTEVSPVPTSPQPELQVIP